ncbi:MAG: MOSC N-terminal beta barrel domain-containing protein [Verrucomicrobia bacterium]|nr:MOSC N-terminal beta barrel domain-containing protein [Leptolyngbya sp. ES-bin-22]
MPELAQILLYPIKALDGVAVAQTTLLASGALKHDREFAIVDLQGKVVNGKRTPAVHGIRSRIDLQTRTITLSLQGEVQAATLHLDDERLALERWLSDYFGFAVKLVQNTQVGFPDDTDAPGPTVISTGTLQAIADWFALSLEETRRRFRSNLELSSVEPFWEDRLFQEGDRTVPFQLGAVQFAGVNPCQRCVVVTRDPITGESLPGFQKTFVAKRKETLPTWTEGSRFNHFFRLAVNTRTLTAQAGKMLRLGDQVTLS